MDKATILTEEQIELLVDNIHLVFGREMVDQMKNTGINFEEILRLSSLGAKSQEVREKRGLAIKEVAAQLKVPQYRLKAIEEHRENEILPEVLERYIKFLKIEKWYKKWAEANPKVSKKLASP